MKKHITLSLLLTLLLAISVDAQTVKINADGDKIVEYTDGTWRYLEPGEEIPSGEIPVAGQEETPAKLNLKEQDAEFQARIDAQLQESHIAVAAIYAAAAASAQRSDSSIEPESRTASSSPSVGNVASAKNVASSPFFNEMAL